MVCRMVWSAMRTIARTLLRSMTFLGTWREVHRYPDGGSDAGAFGHVEEIHGRGSLHWPRVTPEELGPKPILQQFQGAEVGRERAIQEFRTYLLGDKKLHGSLWTLSGRRLVCHCQLSQCCHGDVLVEEFKNSYPGAYDRNKLEGDPPSAAVLNFMARLREEPEDDSDSTADEGVPGKRSGHCGDGEPMAVGLGYTSREYCDGQSLASPGRWPPGSRNYPSRPDWVSVAKRYQKFTEHYGTEQLLVSLALGKVKESPFEKRDIDELKGAVIAELEARGYTLGRCDSDREDVPIYYRYLGLLLRVAEDPEVGIGEYAQRVRVGPGVRMPRLPALYRQKRRWRLPEQSDPLDYLERTPDEGMTWRRKYASLEQWKEQVLDVMHDQASRGMILVLAEAEARRKYLDLIVASLGAIRKDKPSGEVTARVLFDGTHGLSVNRRTRIRDQERSPIASDLKRALREKAKLGEQTFALSANVSEAHRQSIDTSPKIGTIWGARSRLDRTCSSTQWARSGYHRLRTTGHESQEQWDDWRSILLAATLLPGICWWRTISRWSVVGRGTSWGWSSFFVLCATCGVPLSWRKTAGGDRLV